MEARISSEFFFQNKWDPCSKRPRRAKSLALLHYRSLPSLSSVIIVTGHRLNGWSSISGTGKIFFSSPRRPNRLWGPPSLLCNEYLNLFPRKGVKRPGYEADHLYVVPRSRMVDLYFHSPVSFRGVVLN
jgi:hypothetical protein